jgi:hypothetical protein
MAANYLTDNDVDDLARMVVALLSELWIVRDRIAVLEALLTEKGVLPDGAPDNFEWPADKAEQMEALRDTMMAAVIGAPVAAKRRSVEDILARAGHKTNAPIPE